MYLFCWNIGCPNLGSRSCGLSHSINFYSSLFLGCRSCFLFFCSRCRLFLFNYRGRHLLLSNWRSFHLLCVRCRFLLFSCRGWGRCRCRSHNTFLILISGSLFGFIGNNRIRSIKNRHLAYNDNRCCSDWCWWRRDNDTNFDFGFTLSSSLLIDNFRFFLVLFNCG